MRPTGPARKLLSRVHRLRSGPTWSRNSPQSGFYVRRAEGNTQDKAYDPAVQVMSPRKLNTGGLFRGPRHAFTRNQPARSHVRSAFTRTTRIMGRKPNHGKPAWHLTSAKPSSHDYFIFPTPSAKPLICDLRCCVEYRDKTIANQETGIGRLR
jgi:hypothetical protein